MNTTLHSLQRYITSIREDVEWLGWRPNPITHTSDYFDQLYNLAIELIKKDKVRILVRDIDLLNLFELIYFNRCLLFRLMFVIKLKLRLRQGEKLRTKC